MTNPQDALELAVRTARHVKERTVAEYGVGADTHPTLTLYRDGALVAEVLIGSPEPLGYDALSAAVRLFAADRVIVTIESFALTAPDLDTVITEPAPLRQRFANGDPAVCECLWVTVYERDGDAYPFWAPYRYRGRSIEWVDPIDQEPGVLFGETPDAVVRGFQATTQPADQQDAVAELEAMGCLVVLPRAPSAKRNAPCPCGSGRKYKHCHGR